MSSILIVSAIVTVVSLIAFFVINKQASVKNMKVVLFFLISSIIISGIGAISILPWTTASTTAYFVLQVLFLLLGILVNSLLQKDTWGKFENENMSRIFFVLMNAGLGIIGFTFVFNYFNKLDVGDYYATSIILFTVPVLFTAAFKALLAIPVEIHKVWYFPVDGEEPDFDNIDTSKIYLLELEFSKSANDNRVLNNKVKAPLGMGFGDWFSSFINNYNYKFEDDPIRYTDAYNMPVGWIFYTKPTFWKAKMYIDPDKTITDNKLTEKMVIVAKRVEAKED